MLAGSIFRHDQFRLKLLTLFFFCALFILPQQVSAVEKNFTIDDQEGDERTGQVPRYAPQSAWANQACQGCAVQPDVSKLQDGTATAATFMPDKGVTSNTVDFSFNGTAIYIFFTLFYNEGPEVTVNTECNFTLDSQPPVFYNHSADQTIPPKTKRDYGQLVFKQIGLQLGDHHMKISMSDVPYHVFLSFDFARYTTEIALDIPQTASAGASSATNNLQGASSQTTSTLTSSTASSTTKKSPSVAPGIIVGGVLGGLAVLGGFLALLYFYRRDSRRYRPSSPGPTIPRPFGIEMESAVSGGGNGSSSPSTWWSRRTPVTPTSMGGSSRAQNSHTRQSTDMPTSSSSQSHAVSSESPGSRSRSGSSGQGSVEHRIRAANQRMRSLRAEMASVSGRTASSSRSTNSRSSSSRATEELAEEVKRLRQEIQVLKQLQRQQAERLNIPVDSEPPPGYTDE